MWTVAQSRRAQSRARLKQWLPQGHRAPSSSGRAPGHTLQYRVFFFPDKRTQPSDSANKNNLCDKDPFSPGGEPGAGSEGADVTSLLPETRQKAEFRGAGSTPAPPASRSPLCPVPFSPRLPTAGGIYLRKGENNKRTQILCEKEKITKEHSQVARCRKCPVAAGSFAGPRSPGLQPEAAPWPPRSRTAVNRVWSRCVSRQGVCFLLRRKTLKDEDLHPDIKTFCPMVLTSVTPLEPPS